MQTNNQLLRQLPLRDQTRIMAKMQRCDLVYKKDVYLSGDVINDVYFPDSGIISLLAVIGKESTLEVGIVGNEGMVGLSVFLGVKTSINRAVVQGAGAASTLTTAEFLMECEDGQDLSRILRRFTYSLMTQIAQSAVCNRYHPIEARLARWLLMTRDRMHSDEFQITQEFLSNMLGVRREAVSRAATKFHDDNLISYVRGRMIIGDSKELERRACSCYHLIVAEQAVGS